MLHPEYLAPLKNSRIPWIRALDVGVYYIRVVPNPGNIIAYPRIREEATQTYIDGMGTMFAGMGASATFGRVYGYLLLMPAPVSLDQIASDLGAAKSSVSVAARQLQATGMVRRLSQRGSRRVLFEAADSFEGFVEADNQRRAMFVEKLRQGVAIAPGGPVAERISAGASLLQYSIDEARLMLQRWRTAPPRSEG